MKTEQVIEYFKNKAGVARALDIERAAVGRWKVIPFIRQVEIEKLTNGELKAMTLDEYRQATASSK